MIESAAPIPRNINKYTLLVESIPEKSRHVFQMEARKAINYCGIDIGVQDEDPLGKLTPENQRLVDAMMPFIFDHGCMNRLRPLSPVPEKYSIIDGRDLKFNNEGLDAIPVLSAAVLPHFVKNNRLAFVSVDGTGIYGHNGLSAHNADRAIREMLGILNEVSVGQTSGTIRYKGDLFVRYKYVHSYDNREDATKDLKKELKRVLDKSDLEKLKDEDASKITSFRVNPNGEIILDVVRMHEGEDPINTKTIRQPEVIGTLEERMQKLSDLHPEIGDLVEQIRGRKDQKEQSTLISILEESLYDPRCQKVADKYVKKYKEDGFEVMAFQDMRDLQVHMASRNAKLMKLDVPTTLKSINGESGFAENAGDDVLSAIYDNLLDQIKNQIPKSAGILNVDSLRRWGDFYFVDEQANLEQISRAVLKFYHEHPYIKIKRIEGPSNKEFVYEENDNVRFEVEFVKEPPEEYDKDTMVLPLMPIVAMDETIQLRTFDEWTEESRAREIMESNDKNFSTSINLLDDEARDMRARLVSERIGKITPEKRTGDLKPEDVEFLLFKLYDPEDPKRGLPRLNKQLKATPQQIAKMTELKDMLYPNPNLEVEIAIPKKRVLLSRLERMRDASGSDKDIEVYESMIAKLKFSVKQGEVYMSTSERAFLIKKILEENGEGAEQIIEYVAIMSSLAGPVKTDVKHHNGVKITTPGVVDAEIKEIDSVIARLDYLISKPEPLPETD
jgi:hypothetical protein